MLNWLGKKSQTGGALVCPDSSNESLDVILYSE